MIVRCPECSTGFKLPDAQVNSKGVKLRCSKCSHVFRIRRTDDGDTEFFYHESDRKQNQAQDDSEPGAASADGDDQDAGGGDQTGEGNSTQFGMPSIDAEAKKSSIGARKHSKSASSDYNPFPHANLDVDSSKGSPLLGGSKSDTSDAVSDTQTDADDEPERSDPFGDAFDDDQPERSDPFGDAFDDADPTRVAPKDDGSEAGVATRQAPTKPAPTKQEPAPAATNDPAATAEAAAVGTQAGAQPAAAGSPPSSGASAEQDSDFWEQKNSAYKPEEMVDPSFGQNGPAFDPEQGVVDGQQGVADTDQAAATTGSSNATPGAQQPAQQPAQPSAASSAQANSAQANQASSRTADRASWDVDMVETPIEPHTVGGSGVQKFANFALIALIVGVGFVALVAGLSGGVLDLNRFPHMLEVAFQGAEFEPRDEWTTAAPATAPAPEEPIRFEGVFATAVEAGKSDRVILVRGTTKNVAEADYGDVVVRGILYDKNERVIAQATAPLGARLLQSQVAEAGSADEAEELLPDSAKLLSRRSAQPFSLIFSDAPSRAFEGEDVSYRVEIADKTTVGEQAAVADQ